MRTYVIKTTIKTIEQTTINRKWGKIIKEIYTKLLGTKYKLKKNRRGACDKWDFGIMQYLQINGDGQVKYGLQRKDAKWILRKR